MAGIKADIFGNKRIFEYIPQEKNFSILLFNDFKTTREEVV